MTTFIMQTPERPTIKRVIETPDAPMKKSKSDELIIVIDDDEENDPIAASIESLIQMEDSGSDDTSLEEEEEEEEDEEEEDEEEDNSPVEKIDWKKNEKYNKFFLNLTENLEFEELKMFTKKQNELIEDPYHHAMLTMMNYIPSFDDRGNSFDLEESELWVMISKYGIRPPRSWVNYPHSIIHQFQYDDELLEYARSSQR